MRCCHQEYYFQLKVSANMAATEPQVASGQWVWMVLIKPQKWTIYGKLQLFFLQYLSVDN